MLEYSPKHRVYKFNYSTVEGVVHLTGGDSEMEGRVEECHNQVWWAVSDSSSYLDYRDAIIVCRPQQTVCRNCHFILLGVRIRSVASRASPWPLNQHLWISRSGTCFWDGQLCMCNEVWKVCEGKAYALSWKSLRMWARFRTAQNAKIWSFLKTTTRFICFVRRCCSFSYSSFSTRTSRRWGCMYAPPFSHQDPIALSSSLPSQLLPFWSRDDETASAATALRTINLRKCTQLFVNRMF